MHKTINISRQWVLDRAVDVAGSGGTAYLLIHGYPATGFGRIHGGKPDLRLEPDLHGDVELKWDFYFDVRMFGASGEWHCWRLAPSGWQARFATESEWKENANESYFERDYALWGTPPFRTDGDWRECKEGRGARIWIPVSVPVGTSKSPYLRVRQRVEYDNDTGLAGVADAMILGFR